MVRKVRVDAERNYREGREIVLIGLRQPEVEGILGS